MPSLLWLYINFQRPADDPESPESLTVWIWLKLSLEHVPHVPSYMYMYKTLPLIFTPYSWQENLMSVFPTMSNLSLQCHSLVYILALCAKKKIGCLMHSVQRANIIIVTTYFPLPVSMVYDKWHGFKFVQFISIWQKRPVLWHFISYLSRGSSQKREYSLCGASSSWAGGPSGLSY